VNVTIISEFGGMWRGTAATSFWVSIQIHHKYLRKKKQEPFIINVWEKHKTFSLHD
jgi:hypothetical protein